MEKPSHFMTMKEQIMALLDEWKEKQPPELAQPDKKKDLEK